MYSVAPYFRDAVDPGVTGIMIPVRGPATLADALGSLIADPARCQAMGNAGTALAERAFDVREVFAHKCGSTKS